MKKLFAFFILSVSLLFASVEIKPGWNLISVPINTNSEFDLETLLSGKATIAWKFNTSSTGAYAWEQWTPGRSVKMKNGDGIFVGVSSGTHEIYFNGTTTQGPVIFDAQNYLKDKWYLIGFGYDIAIADIVAAYPDSVIWTMENGSYTLLTNASDIIKAGQGFWFKNKGSKAVYTPPKLFVEGGSFQTVPFTLNATLTSYARDLNVSYYLDNTKYSMVNIPISQSGRYTLKAISTSNGKETLLDEVIISATQKTDIATLATSGDSPNEIVLTDDESSALAGMKIRVLPGALPANTPLSIKSNSENHLSTEFGNSLGNVLSLEPSGLAFTQPVQITMPFDPRIVRDPENLFIARHNSDNTTDYIYPISVDTDNSEVHFETDHFSEFSLQYNKNFLGISKGTLTAESQTVINDLKTISGNSTLSNQKWVELMNKNVISKVSLNIFDLYNAYKLNINLKSLVDDGKYLDALNVIFPNVEANSELNMLIYQIQLAQNLNISNTANIFSHTD
jgi:hypothetical protein